MALRSASVLQIGPYPPSYTGWSLRIAYLKAALNEAGHHCVVLNIGDSRHAENSQCESVHHAGDYIGKLVRFARQGFLFHIHVNGCSRRGLCAALVAVAVSRMYGRRPVVTFHAGADQLYFPRQKSRMLAPAFRHLFRSAGRIVCNNQDVQARIAEYGVAAEKIVVIPGFSRRHLQEPPVTLDDSTDEFLANHEPILLTYVEDRIEYNLPVLFEALSQVRDRLDNPGLIVVGANDPESQVSQLLSANHWMQDALHLSNMEHARFLALLQRANVYVRSARSEGTSSSIRESLCLGVPVVANEIGSHPRGVVTYPWGDSAKMAACILRAISDPPGGEPPDAGDTIQDEVELLVDFAQSSRVR